MTGITILNNRRCLSFWKMNEGNGGNMINFILLRRNHLSYEAEDRNCVIKRGAFIDQQPTELAVKSLGNTASEHL